MKHPIPLLAVLTLAAQALPMAAQAGPTFTVTEVDRASGNPIAPFTMVDTLVLKETLPTVPAGQTPVPLFTLSLTTYGDNSALCTALAAALGSPATQTFEVDVDFFGLGGADAGTMAPPIALTGLLSVQRQAPDSDDGDFDSVNDFPTEKIQLSFASCLVNPGGSESEKGRMKQN